MNVQVSTKNQPEFLIFKMTISSMGQSQEPSHFSLKEFHVLVWAAVTETKTTAGSRSALGTPLGSI